MTLLYAAFAVVALWLLGELLLQRRAPLHWRALALVGFLVLVAGVAQRSLPLIGAGVVAFGAGQALATRAVKRSAGASHWSLVAPESVPVVGRLFGAEESAPAPEGRSRAARPEPTPQPERVAEQAPEPLPQAVEATAVHQGDSVYYTQPEQEQQQAAYYAYTAEQQVAYADPQAVPYGDPYAQPYQQQYQEYAPYQQSYEPQYEQQYEQSYAPQYQQYPEYQQQYAAAYEQPQQPYGTYEQPQQSGHEGYDYEQAGYYTQHPQG
ncbi:hypothetical protein [Streptacidiphilus jiangxiensis]|uniref:Uncharacterized protein n=1 Tax=Streptacidiphilus jiangxiensis TaxID=235985 RepID=A0A1H7SP00_STRJI|nr:hypothetical protein [Streptacidiphilus jiangxiensis]SEL74352.1 hypothetical protein SAMN05414137_112135 [Streptacidiphilus jiangxiensis]